MGDFFVLAAFFGALLLVFPVFVYADAYADATERKVWFSFGIFRLRLWGGYAALCREGICLHLSDKKAVIVPYGKLAAGTSKKLAFHTAFRLVRYRQTAEIGTADNPACILLAALLQAGSSQVFSVLQTKRPFLSLKSHTLLSAGGGFRLTAEATAVCNGLALALTGAKLLWEAFRHWIANKSTASWKKRRSSFTASST